MSEEKKLQFVADVRQLARDYQLWVQRANALCGASAGAWGSLYQAILTETDLPDAIIPEDGKTKLEALTAIVANFQTMVANYENGIDGIIERIK